MMGFECPANFNLPYISGSITEFWRRWHISLSGWFRDYIYIPLGGNRCSAGRQMLNMLAVWALTGIWHGANWNFICWGLYYFVLLVIEKNFLMKYLKKGKVWPHIYTLFLVVLGWGLFTCNAPGAPLAAAAEKVHVLDFPSLVPPAAVPNHAADSKKRCVFCGSLYPGLREPGFALELFRALGPASGWTLTMAGGGWQYFATDAAQTKAVLGEQFEQPGPVPAETARTMQAQADVLLNLGNAVDNQLPSKLFDYFAAGKPVLHLCVIENDPALPYLARYPLALVLHQGQADAADILHRWLGEVCGKQLPFGEVCDLFPELVPQAVAAEFVRWLM